MSQYVLYTDSGCDIAPAKLKEWGVKCVPLIFRFDGSDQEYTNEDIPVKDFYDAMRAGKSVKTSAANVETFKQAFETELKNGDDVLYLAFSSGLSNTCNAARLAANELEESYPDRKVIVLDTLLASAGQGMLVRIAVDQKASGASLEECAAYMREASPKACAWFTVDELTYLKRGGRISPTVALIGSMLSIKPVMHMDDEGHLVKVGQVRGRKAALKAIVDKFSENALDPEHGYCYVCNADCMDDVQRIREMIQARHGRDVDLIADIGPVIGAHCGPGTIAVFCLAKER